MYLSGVVYLGPWRACIAKFVLVGFGFNVNVVKFAQFASGAGRSDGTLEVVLHWGRCEFVERTFEHE